MALSSRKGSNLIPLTTKAPTKFHGIADTENSDREGTPTGKNGKKMINTKSYYMGTVSTQANTEPNQHSGYEDSTRAKTQVYSKKVTQDSRLHTETVDYSPRMRTTWSQNPFLDPESTHTKMMLKTAPNMLQQFDPNESFVESHRKALWSSHQNYLDKFHKSIELLNNSDKRKVPISKTVFMSKTQKELIKKFNSKGTTFTEGGPIKTIKENRREPIYELMPYKTIYCKIDSSYKLFPLNFKSNVQTGSFEIYVSKSIPYPNKDFNDYIFDDDNFNIEYEGNVPTVYFCITALQYLKMSFVMNFKSEKEDKIRKEKQLAKEKNKFSNKSRVKMQLSPEELLELESTAAEILQEKRQKMLQLAKNRDIIKMNKTIAGEFRSFKEKQIENITSSLNTHYDRFLENRKQIENMKKMKQTYTLYKRPLMQLERQWNEMEKQKALAKQRFEMSWSITLTLYHLTQSIIEKKKAVIALRIMKRIREDNANRIQRASKNYLNRSLIMCNPGSKVEYEDKTLEGKYKFYLLQGLMSFANISNKIKAKKAGHVLVKFFGDLHMPLGFFAAYGEYVKGIINFQRKWRHYSEINKARAHIFIKCWNKYCLGVLDDESRKKKKRYTEQILKLKDKHIMKYAKEYVINKNKGFQKAFRLMTDRAGSIDEILPGKLGQSPKSAFVTADTKKKPENTSIKKDETKSNTEKPGSRSKPSYQPTKEEMKEIFEKVMEETKFLMEGLLE